MRGHSFLEEVGVHICMIGGLGARVPCFFETLRRSGKPNI